MLPVIKKVCAAWLEVKGETIQALALPESVRFNADATELFLNFKAKNESAELDAIAIAKNFSVEENVEVQEVLSAKIVKRVGTLKTSTGDRHFQLNFDCLHQALGYYLLDESKENGEGNSLEIVLSRKEINSDDQIAINKRQQVYASENLNDKTIKLKTSVIYPKRIMLLNEPLGVISAILVVFDSNENFLALTVMGEVVAHDSLLPKNQLRSVRMSVGSIETEVLCSA